MRHDSTAEVIVRADRIIGSPTDGDAIAIAGGRILEVGALDDLRARLPEAEIIDYGDATVTPGFHDAHLHLMMLVEQLAGVVVSPEDVPDERELVSRIAAEHARLPAGAWLRAWRYDHIVSSGGRIWTRRDLDAIVGDRPAVVTHVGAHWGVASSAALVALGVDRRTKDPTWGAYGRDGDGEPTGYLSEQALFDIVYPSLSRRPDLAPDHELADVVDRIEIASQHLRNHGITSVGDCMIGPAELRALAEAEAQGRLKVRVTCYVTEPHLDALAAAGMTSGFGSDRLRIGGVKIFLDGAVAGRSCAVAEPFEGTDDYGVLTYDRESIADVLRRADDAGLTLAVHANGERAIEMFLDAMERSGSSGRHRIEHASLLTPELIARIARHDLMVVPFASYPAYRGDTLLEWYGAERAGRMFAHRWLLDAGITTASSSDYPCGPLDPRLGLQSLVTRRTPRGQEFGVDQAVSLDEAIALYTSGSASATGAEALGSLSPGHHADLTVFAGDIRRVDPALLASIVVRTTWIEGKEQ